MAEMPITRMATAGKIYSGTQAPTLIVIHDVEAPCTVGRAKAVADYFATSAAGGVAHYTVDPATTTHSVPENRGAAHCGEPGNFNSIGIEMCGYAADDWLDAAHTATWKRAADLARDIAARWRIPLDYLDAAALRAGKRRGWTYHKDITAGLGGTTHTDPGPRFPHAAFTAYLLRDTATAYTATKRQPRPWDYTAEPCVRIFQELVGVTVDGDAGPKTDAAVRARQQKLGVRVDGAYGPATLARDLTSRGWFGRGARGAHVRAVQWIAGWDAPDAIYGDQTEGRIDEMRRWAGLGLSDGVGADTIRAIVR